MKKKALMISLLLVTSLLPVACGKKKPAADTGNAVTITASSEVEKETPAKDTETGEDVEAEGISSVSEEEIDYNANYKEIPITFDYSEINMDMTEDELKSALGDPDATSAGEAGTIYQYEGCGWKTYGGTITVGFDENHQVKNIQWEYIGPDAETRDQLKSELLTDLTAKYGESVASEANAVAWEQDGRHIEVQTMDSVSPYLSYTVVDTSNIGAHV